MNFIWKLRNLKHKYLFVRIFNGAVTSDKICRMKEASTCVKVPIQVKSPLTKFQIKSPKKYVDPVRRFWTPCESHTSFWRFKRKFCHHPRSKLSPAGTDISEEYCASTCRISGTWSWRCRQHKIQKPVKVLYFHTVPNARNGYPH
jgi:hypothetical protein